MSQLSERRTFRITRMRPLEKPHFRPVEALDLRPGDTLLSANDSGFMPVEVIQVVSSVITSEVRILGKSESVPNWHAIVPLSVQLWRQVK